MEHYSAKIYGNQMNAQESREFVRRKCIEANPDILKLEFGCRVIFGKEYTYKVYTCLGKSEGYYQYWVDKGDEERCNYVVSERDGWKPAEIIGRPIQLADVLLALGKQHGFNKVGVQADGLIERVPLYNDRRKITVMWNLLKSLDDQSDETVIKLAEMMR